MKAAERSSEMILTWIPGCLTKPIVNGAQRDPGERITCSIPFLWQSATSSIMGCKIKLLGFEEIYQ
jgi:hypothetical protein